MVNRYCFLVAFCFALMLALAALGGERVYDFSNDDEWEPITAEWEIVDGEYVKIDPDTSTAGIAVLKESEEIDTIDVESIEVMGNDLGTGAWQNMYIVFGFDEGNPLSYSAGPFVGGAQEWRFQSFNSANRGGVATIKGMAGQLAPNTWYQVKVVFEGDEAVLFGAEEGEELEEILRHSFPGGIPSGRIGIGSNGSDVKFDNFKVIGPGVASLAVRPEEKLPVAWGSIKAE